MFTDNTGKRAAVTDTLIGQGTAAEGKIECDAGLRIEGEYRGKILCKGDVVIGECGIARADIEARDVTVAGKVYGDIQRSGRLTVTSSGELHGNVSAKSLIMQDGAVLNGQCHMEKASALRPAGARGASDDPSSASASAGEEQTETKAKQAG